MAITAQFEHAACDVSSCGAVRYSAGGTWPNYLTLGTMDGKIMVDGA